MNRAKSLFEFCKQYTLKAEFSEPVRLMLLWDRYANYLVAVNDDKTALKYFQRAAEVGADTEPKFVYMRINVFLGLADCHKRLGNLPAAISALEAAKAIASQEQCELLEKRITSYRLGN